MNFSKFIIFLFWLFIVEANDGADLMRLAMTKLDGPSSTTLTTSWDNAWRACGNKKSCEGDFDNTATHLEQVSNGFIAAQNLVDGFNQVLSQSTTESVRTFASRLGQLAPFLGAVGPILTIASLFGNSPEVERLNALLNIVSKGFARMDARFDEIENQLKDVQRLVEREHFWTRLHPSLVDLTVNQQRIDNYYKASDPAVKTQRQNDMSQDYYDEIFRAIYAIAGSFDGSHQLTRLCDDVRSFSAVDRREVLQVSIYLFNRMVKGAHHLVFMGSLLGKNDVSATRTEMVNLLTRIGNKIRSCDNDIIRTHWKNQWLTDLRRVMNRYTSGGQEQALATSIDVTMKEKYYWRDWLTVVYSERVGGDKHWVGVCYRDTYSYMELHRGKKYNILVGSVDKTHRVRKTNLYNVATYKREKIRGFRGRYTYKTTSYDAKKIYEQFPTSVRNCGQYMIRGVVRKEGIFVLKAPNNRKNLISKSNMKRVCTGGRNNRKCSYQQYHLFALG